MKELIGKTVTKIGVSQDQSVIMFVQDDATSTAFQASGDCCSESWFADITFQNHWGTSGLPLVVNEVSEIEVPDFVLKMIEKDGRTRQDYDQVYGYKLVTNKGTCEIIYRNSSNGYYGGDCNVMKPEECKWDKKSLEEAVWEYIEDDWMA